MAAVTGYLRYDKERSAVSSDSLAGIPLVSIVLQNIDTNEYYSVYTDATGKYTFYNVPDGNYRIVEAYGAPADASPGNYSRYATPGDTVSASFPPINAVQNPPAGATNLDGTTPTTLLVTVSGEDLNNQDILNGPIKYAPIHTILDTGVVISPDNLITEADNGSFGSFPGGTPANTGVDPNPYPNIGSQFEYTQPNPLGVNPGGGQYTIQNTMNDATAAVQNTWWRVSDHTTGNETGRMMVINGDLPGKVLFEQKVNVKPETYYLMSSWILNLSKSTALIDPQLGVQVLDDDGKILYNATLGTLIPVDKNNPEWKQIGTVFNSQDNKNLTIRFTSMGPETVGNDYAIDDIALNEVQVTAYSPKKSADKAVSHVGDVVTYTVSLENTGVNPLGNVNIKDAVPKGFTFVPGSVSINGVSAPSADPNSGFAAPDVLSGETLTVTFKASADYVPEVNPTVNTASAGYTYSPVSGGIPVAYNKTSNDTTVAVQPVSADISVLKTASGKTAAPGSKLTYTLTAVNNGPDTAQNVTLSDRTPDGLLSPEYSTDGGATWQPWSGTYMRKSMAAGENISILIRGTVSPDASGTWINIGMASSTTDDPNTDNNSDTAITQITPPAPVKSADVSIVKTAKVSGIYPCKKILYTLTVSNAGPTEAENVTVKDLLPDKAESAVYSLNSGSLWQKWPGSVNIGSLAAGSRKTILIECCLERFASGRILNRAEVFSSTHDGNPNNNFSEAEIRICF